MADTLRVNTDLLDKSANALKAAGQGFGEAASILAGLDTSQEWWTKMGRINPISLQDEGSSVDLGDAGAAVRALTSVLRRYDSRTMTLGNNVSRAANLFKDLENQLINRANSQSAGSEGNVIGAVGAAAGVAEGADTAKKAKSEADAKKERETHAKWLKIGVGALCFVGSVAVVFATGGAALPVIAAGAAAGAITAGVNNAADQYVEKGLDDINWADAGKDAVIGGIVGAVTSTISIAGGGVAQQAVNRVTGQITPYMTSAAGRLATHAFGGSVASVATGMATRGSGEAVRQYMSEGSVDWNTVRDRALDPGQMAVDATTGGVTGYMTGRQYNRNIEYQKDNGMFLRSEEYRNNNPYSKSYGDVDWKQAPNGGAIKGTEVQDYVIPENTVLRRSGPETGSYVRGANDSFESVSLPYAKNPSIEHKYVVRKPIPNVTKSQAAPAFDMPGGGTQYQLPKGLDYYLNPSNGYVERIY